MHYTALEPIDLQKEPPEGKQEVLNVKIPISAIHFNCPLKESALRKAAEAGSANYEGLAKYLEAAFTERGIVMCDYDSQMCDRNSPIEL